MSSYTLSERAPQKLYHTWDHARHVCQVWHLWLSSRLRIRFLKFSPPCGREKTWEKSGKNREKNFFSKFEILSTAYYKTSLGMIFHLNKRSCEMHGTRVISPSILARNSKVRFFSNISQTKQFLEKRIEMNPYYFSICDILALEIPL